MTEQTWQEGQSLSKMREHLFGTIWSRFPFRWVSPHVRLVSQRCLRLYLCGLGHHSINRLTAPMQNLLEVAELFADGKVDSAGLEVAELDADIMRNKNPGMIWRAIWNTMRGLPQQAEPQLRIPYQEVLSLLPIEPIDLVDLASPCEEEVEMAILRDIFGGNLLQPELTEEWLQYRHGLLPKMAADIYDRQQFGELPILADVLEDAGCDEDDILSHCREEPLHVRGCWVLDMLLQRDQPRKKVASEPTISEA